ncbi:Ribonuclease MRP protein subunit rmp1 [Recurvomyces mirabilis]|uniref:Ribonuclease MRP protein subunit rmp1 n=1 Tax=Recurvomyces mirabilis TaxID=574656 RepID=A0AAE0WR65_9PEZI|nr:Ribonuclease MRP protein subunit rmp1 [Recurvomyces mirabilis]KAK5154711.1 RNase MRP subunit [Recurvomyces mirabilis]
MDLLHVHQLSNEDFEMLQHLNDILHLFQHRNKNQHRRSVWWRHFSVYKKRLEQIVSRLSELREVPSTHLARTKKQAEDESVKFHLQQSLGLWRDVLVPGWQHAFSQLAADGRFAVLGLVLLSVLAESCRLLGITAAFEDLGQHEIEQVLEQFGEEWQPGRAGPGGLDKQREDVGEVIIRDAEVGTDAVTGVTTTSSAKASGPHDPASQSKGPEKAVSSVHTKRPASKIIIGIKNKTKTKKSNAIDDLFDGFG